MKGLKGEEGGVVADQKVEQYHNNIAQTVYTFRDVRGHTRSNVGNAERQCWRGLECFWQMFEFSNLVWNYDYPLLVTFATKM